MARARSSAAPSRPSPGAPEHRGAPPRARSGTPRRDRLDVRCRHARAPSLLRVLRPRPSAALARRAHLHVRVHVLRRVRRDAARRRGPELRRQLRAPAGPPARGARARSRLDGPGLRARGLRRAVDESFHGWVVRPRRPRRRRAVRGRRAARRATTPAWARAPGLAVLALALSAGAGWQAAAARVVVAREQRRIEGGWPGGGIASVSAAVTRA